MDDDADKNVNEISREGLPSRFERLCRDILALYLKVNVPDIEPSNSGIDFIVTSNSSRLIAEVRLYRSVRTPQSALSKALDLLRMAQMRLNASRAVLMVSSIVSFEQRRMAENAQIDLLGLQDLHRLAAVSQQYTTRLAEIFAEATNQGIDEALADSKFVENENASFIGSVQSIVAPTLSPGPNEGVALCADIRAVPAAQSKAYELALEAALKYIFADELSKWRRQNTQTDLLKPDLVAKIRYDAKAFWQELVRDFSTRFVCFDCKNYADTVDQSQVYSTEKYLHAHARRGAAIIISRKGVDKGARLAMQGALRESGRIITWLTDDDICVMLDARDKGREVNEILSERIDDMLLRVSR